MPSLVELPNELLLHIVSILRETKGIAPQAALASLCLTSRRLNDIAQPILFTAPQLYLLRGSDPLRHWWQFARTVLETRDLALRVRKLSLEAPAYDDDDGEEEIASLRFDIDQCSAVKSAVNEDLGSQLFVHRLATLLITPLEKLEHLYLHLTTTANNTIIRILHLSSKTYLSHVPRLKGLYVEPIANRKFPDLAVAMENVLLSPYLQRLSVQSLTFIEPFPLTWRGPQVQPLELVELHLRGCYVMLSFIEPWFEACRHLKAVTFTSIADDAEGRFIQLRRPHYRKLTPMQLLRALRSCTGTLERLDADFRGVYELDCLSVSFVEDELPDLGNDFTYESFQEFTQLRHLRVEAVRFRDVGTLPSSLETLTLFGDDLGSVTRRCHTDFGNLRREQCPGLEKICLQYGCMGEAEMQSTLAAMEWTDKEDGYKNGPELMLECELSGYGALTT